MAYIGNNPTSAPFITDTFTGTGSQTAFTGMTYAPAATSSIAVYVNGSYQTPTTDYTVSGTTLNFVSAPAGSAEIVVLHLGVGAAATTTVADGAITTAKIANESITLEKLAADAVLPQIFKPSITSPANNATGIINNQLITASPYLSLYGRSQANANWQISTSPTFAFINVASTINGSNTQFQVNSSSGLVESTVHYARVRYSDDANNSSDYSDTVQFTTGSFPFPVEFLVVAGGGGGGFSGGGGGGAGGYRTSVGTSGGGASSESALTISLSTNYTVTVGGGGAGRSDGNATGAPGNPSVFSTVTSTAGGGGGSRDNAYSGAPGGSGGGGTRTSGSGGTGASGQGFPGGGNGSGAAPGAGGGGAGAAGVNASGSPPTSGDGGAGVSSLITGSPVARGGGGGGGGGDGSRNPVGGTGGGGRGGYSTTYGADAGTVNTGGGGGAGSNEVVYQNGASGGSGVVILRYPNTKTISNPGGGLTYTTAPVSSNTVATFTAGTGNVSWS